MSEAHDQFRCGMTNFRPNISMMCHQENILQDLSGSQQEMSYMQRMDNRNCP